MTRPVTLVRYTALGIGLIYSTVLALAGVQLDSPLKMVIGWIPAAAGVCLLVWDVWFWRLPGFQKLTRRPRIDGLWEVTLRPTDESHIPSGGNRGPIRAFIEVRQSFWSLHIHQHTGESGSDSRTFVWELSPGREVATLVFVYENAPRPEHLGRSPRHRGTCALETSSLIPTSIDGTYFTDRYTQGDMQLRLVDRTHGYPNFAAANAHADNLPTG